MTTISPLSQLGWKPFFQQQLSLEELADYQPVRVAVQHRSKYELYSEEGRKILQASSNQPSLVVGDWVLLDREGGFYRALERLSCFSRKAAGSRISEQLIAANVDTVFITCALNQNFSLSRIERYLALTREAGAEAVVVLTKADLCDDPYSLVSQVQALDSRLLVEAVNALDEQSTGVLAPWCRAGSTVALLGSSGVGKSTLINSLMGCPVQHTQAAREDDDRGRHTTTARSLHLIPGGGVLLDTPGMRELQLSSCEAGIEATFADISALASQCRFTDCQHQNEPGCAVQAALQASQIDQRRLTNYLKLKQEQARNSLTLAQSRAKERALSRYYRKVLHDSIKLKKSD